MSNDGEIPCFFSSTPISSGLILYKSIIPAGSWALSIDTGNKTVSFSLRSKRRENVHESDANFRFAQNHYLCHRNREEFPIFVTLKVFDIPEQTFDFRLSCLTDVRETGQPEGSRVTFVLTQVCIKTGYVGEPTYVVNFETGVSRFRTLTSPYTKKTHSGMSGLFLSFG